MDEQQLFDDGSRPSPARRDLAFEALAEVTGSDWEVHRGKLNAALAAIKEQSDGIEGEILAAAIYEQAVRYRKVMGAGILLTPNALAEHWSRLVDAERALEAGRLEERSRTDSKGSNRSAPIIHCETCKGDRMVLSFYRPADRPSVWALEHRDARHPDFGLPHRDHRKPTDGYEEWNPCPACNPQALAIAIDYREKFDRFHPKARPSTLTFSDRPTDPVE